MTPEIAVAEKQTKRVAVVIVSLNRMTQLRQSLEMLGEGGVQAHQVIVVDNGSTDGSAFAGDDFPGVRSMRLPKNFGSTKALNVGLRTAESEYILFLHDDARISGESVTRLADYLEAHPEAYGVCPRLTDAAGNPVPQVSALPAPGNINPLLQVPKSESEEVAAECVSGAAVMYTAFFIRALRQIDERYGDYGGNLDLCAQTRRAGKKIVILRNITAIHESLASPVAQNLLDGDRAAGTAVFLAKYHGFMVSLLYRLKTALGAIFTFRFGVAAGALSGQKIDGSA